MFSLLHWNVIEHDQQHHILVLNIWLLVGVTLKRTALIKTCLHSLISIIIAMSVFITLSMKMLHIIAKLIIQTVGTKNHIIASYYINL